MSLLHEVHTLHSIKPTFLDHSAPFVDPINAWSRHHIHWSTNTVVGPLQRKWVKLDNKSRWDIFFSFCEGVAYKHVCISAAGNLIFHLIYSSR